MDGVETDVTQALTDQGEYLYECGEGEEQAQVRVYLDEQGAPRLMTSFSQPERTAERGRLWLSRRTGRSKETPP